MGNDRVRKYALGRADASLGVVGLSVGYGVTEFLGKNTGEVRTVDACAAVCGVGRDERRRLVTQTSGTIGRGRYGEELCLPDGLPGSLVVGEEEYFVPFDRTAHGSTKLVLNINSAGWGIVVSGIQVGVAQKFEDVAVKAVGPGLGDDIDLAAAIVAIFCVEVIGNDAKLGDRVEVGNQCGAVVNAFLRISAVDHKPICAGSTAVDGLSPIGKVAGYASL